MSIEGILKKLAATFMFSGNSWLRDYEYESIGEFLRLLNSNDKGKILSQLHKYNVIQRSHDGKIVQFYDSIDQYRKRWRDELKVDIGDKVEKKYKLDFISKNNERVVGNVFIGNGYITCIEYKILPYKYIPKCIRIYEVTKKLEIY